MTPSVGMAAATDSSTSADGGPTAPETVASVAAAIHLEELHAAHNYHPLEVVVGREFGTEAPADDLRWRIRGDQRRPALLQFLQLAKQLVEFGVRDGGRVKHVVAELMTTHGLDKIAVLASYLGWQFGIHARLFGADARPRKQVFGTDARPRKRVFGVHARPRKRVFGRHAREINRELRQWANCRASAAR